MKTADKIIKKIDEMRQENFLDGSKYLDTAIALANCLIDEHSELERLRQEVAQKKLGYLEAQEKRNVSEAQIKVEAEDLYREMKEQEHRISRIEEFIRLCKLQGQTASSQY